MPVGFPISDGAGNGTSAADMRQVIASHWHNMGVIRGCGVGTASSGLTYSVAAGNAVSSRSAAYGAVEFPVPASTVTTTAGPASGTRIDVVYARPLDPSQGDASTDVEVKVAQGTASTGTPSSPTIPAGAVELRRFIVPQGMSKTSQATATGSVNYAIPYGGGLGVLHKWTDQANGLANQNLLRLGNGTIYLPTDRAVEFQIMPTISTNADNHDGVALYRFILDGVVIASFEIMYREHWETRFLALPFTLTAGTHSVAYERYKRAGDDFYHHYGAQNGETYLGTVFQVVDRGVAQ